MNIPEELHRLEEPKFILMPPVALQYGFLSIALVLGVSGLVWGLYSLVSTGSLSGAQIFCGILSAFALVTVTRRGTWRRWASFACDRNGVYLGKTFGGYTFRSWEDVAGAYIGTVSSGDQLYEDVLLRVKFTDEQWSEHSGRKEKAPVKEDGFVHHPVGQQCRDVKETLSAIERIGSLSGKMAPQGLIAPAPCKTKPAIRIFIAVFCLIFLGMGSLVVAKTTKRVMRSYALVHSGASASGAVIEYKQGYGRSRGIWPVVSFQTPEGRVVQFESQYHPNYSGYSIGQTVPVLYSRDEPAVAEINEPERLWGGVALGYLAGGLFMIFGAGGIAYAMRRSL